MTNLAVYNHKGQKISSLTVSKQMFAAKINPPLMAQAVRVYLSNQRQAAAKTKTRGEVKVTKAKVWRQKGTGRARHGSRNAPIFVGGAKAHGPTGTQNFRRQLSKAMKKKSLFSALSAHLKADGIMVADKLDQLPAKTQPFNQLFRKLIKSPRQVLFLIDKSELKLRRSTGNLAYATTLLVTNLNTYQVLKAKTLIFTKAGIKSLHQHYGFD